MKVCRPRALPACLLAWALLFPAAAAADEFSEYRIPEHAWSSGSATFTTNASRTQRSLQYAAAESRTGALSGSLSASLARGWDGDRRQFGWQMSALVAEDATHDETQQLYSPVTVDHTVLNQQDRQNVGGSAWLRRYLADGAIGMEFSAAGSASLRQRWGRADARYYLPGEATPYLRARDARQTSDYAYQARLVSAIGHGIVRDATPVEDAHVVESRLMAVGALTRPLSPNARERLAALIAVGPRLGAAHDRPDRFLWREVERILAEDGALAAAGLTAYGVERAREPYAMRGLRRRGHFVGLTVSLEHSDVIRRDGAQSSVATYANGVLTTWSDLADFRRSASSRDVARGGGKAEWHAPVGWRWQWDASAAASTPLRPGESGLRTDAAVQGSWHVADRWLAQGSIAHQREYSKPRDRTRSADIDRWETDIVLALSYYLEDRTQLSLTVEDGQGRSRPDYGGFAASEFGHQTRMFAGITYRFLGRVSAPGLFETMTPM